LGEVPADPREAAWFAVHDALPPGWRVGPATYGRGRHLWSVTARGSHPGRGKAPVTVIGSGEDELAAVGDLDARLRGAPRPGEDAARREALNRRLRLAFYQGATDEMARFGRTFDAADVRRVLGRYPGDLPMPGRNHGV